MSKRSILAYAMRDYGYGLNEVARVLGVDMFTASKIAASGAAEMTKALGLRRDTKLQAFSDNAWWAAMKSMQDAGHFQDYPVARTDKRCPMWGWNDPK